MCRVVTLQFFQVAATAIPTLFIALAFTSGALFPRFKDSETGPFVGASVWMFVVAGLVSFIAAGEIEALRALYLNAPTRKTVSDVTVAMALEFILIEYGLFAKMLEPVLKEVGGRQRNFLKNMTFVLPLSTVLFFLVHYGQW